MGVAAGLLALVVAAAMIVDTGIGRRFITDRIANVAPESGLRIRIGSIEGSIYRSATLRDVVLLDPKGAFLRIPEARLSWHPFDFLLRNQLTIDSLDIPAADLARLPELRPTTNSGPILPNFDIALGRLNVQRLTLGAAVAGRMQVASINGSADIRDGTALINLDARSPTAGDRLRALVTVAPDRGDFDLDGDVVAPRGGVFAGIAGLDRSLTGMVRGQGTWQQWRGSIVADSDGAAIARMQMTASAGRYQLSGRAWPGVITGGVVQQLAADGLAIDADGRFADRQLSGTLNLVGDALQLDASGGVDLARNRFDALRLDAWLRRPGGILNNLDGQNIRAAIRLSGAMAGPRVEYRVTAPWLAYGSTRLTGVVASGEGIAGQAVTRLPLTLRVDRITGLGALAEGIVRNLRAEGTLRLADNVLTTDLLRVRSDGLDGNITLLANFASGDWLVGYDGALPGLEIAGLGRVDLLTDLNARRAATGGFAIDGTARATMRRLDNGFLRTLTGGLPVLNTRLAIGGDGIVRFNNLVVRSPLLNLTGQGYRRADGSFFITGEGTHRTYGPVRMVLDGPIDRPKVDLILANPLPAAQLGGVRLQLVPTAQGFSFTSTGQSILGAYTANGDILLPRGGNVVIAIERLAVGQTVARGNLSVVEGGLAGTLAIAGGGLDGTVVLDVPGGTQRIAAHLTARNASFAGANPISIARGQLDATLLLARGGTTIEATVETTGARYGSLSIARAAGTVRMVNGTGQARVTMAGARGRRFELSLVIDIAPDRYRISGNGSFAGRAIRISRPAVLRRDGSGWILEDSEMSFARGRIRASGAFGGARTAIDAALDNVPLSLLDIAYPDSGFGGSATGRIRYSATGNVPTGTAELRIARFQRAGLTDGGAPLDIGINASLATGAAAIRGVVERGGSVIGRVQARLAPLGGGDDIMRRLLTAPMSAQLRYNGDSAPLWRLANIETLALSGPVAIAADATGTLERPQISGAVRAVGARVESAATGTVLTNINAVGRFAGSRLQLRNLSGMTAGGGRVTGEGDLDLAAANGFGMDLRVNAANALLLDRDDIAARVTGAIRMFSDGAGGSISGRLRLDSGRFRLGQATAAEALPVINVIELNRPADRPQLATAARAPWMLDISVRGDDRFNVTGLGLDSDWSTDVRVRGPLDNFTILGSAEMQRGGFEFAGRRFELRSGSIRFTGSTPVDPVLDILAVSDITGIDAQVRVRGTGQRPEISFSSNPALPEDELLSRILFGSSITDISVTEAAQLGIALASLRSGDGGLDPINAIRRATGLDRLRILPANAAIGSGTSIAAGKFLTRRIYVEVITDGQGYSATRVEYQVTRWLAILAAISTLGNDSVNVRIRHDY